MCNLRVSVGRQILCLQRSGQQKWVSSPQSLRREKIEPLRSVCALCPSDFRGALVLKVHRFSSSMSACVGKFGKHSPAVYSVYQHALQVAQPVVSIQMLPRLQSSLFKDVIHKKDRSFGAQTNGFLSR